VRATFLAGLVVVKAGGVDALGKAHVKSKVARASVCWDVGVPAALKMFINLWASVTISKTN
jgi:hypothetical protein